MRIFVVSLLVFASVIASATPSEASPMERIRQSNDATSQLYRNLQEEIIQADIDHTNKCKSPHYSNAQRIVDQIGAKAAGLYGVTRQFGRYSDAEISMARDQLVPAINYHINGLLELGETAARDSCKKIAKAAYEEVINTYMGSKYSGYRDRAKIALDNLR